MQGEFDRGLFATMLLALALLISVSSVARFPAMLRPVRPTSALPADVVHGIADGWVATLR